MSKLQEQPNTAWSNLGMAESYRPSTPVARALERVKRNLQALWTIGGVVVATTLGMWTFYSNLATDAEVSDSLEAHSWDSKAHPALRDRVEAAEAAIRVLQQQTLQNRASEVSLGERLVSLIAADRESNHALKAASAAACRDEYRRLMRKGVDIDDAIVEALRTKHR